MPPRSAPRPRLRELADRLGILSEYVDQTGRRTLRTRDEAREIFLGVMGFEAPTEDAARGWLDELDHEERQTIAAPVRVVERDARDVHRVRIRLPSGVPKADVELILKEEGGRLWRVRQTLRRETATIDLPTHPPYGYHHLTVMVRSAAGERSAEQELIVVPSACLKPEALFERRKAMGIVANLYSVRREHDWGIGDAATLEQLVDWAADRGAAFVGVNPLHALFNRGIDISPYSPVSRLFRNHIYIDVERVPELSYSEDARALLASSQIRDALAELRATTRVDYDRVIALKHQALSLLYRTFRKRASTAGLDRSRAFAEYVRVREPDLTRYATWMAIAEESGTPDWRRWPAALRTPDSEATRAFQQSHSNAIAFHRWLQYETDRQLREVAERSRVAGMDIGVYQDLAIGTSPGGSDTWSYPDLFLSGASLGAPPDPYAATGQNWGLPVMDPRALRAQRYRYWVQLLRRALEHTGALRIDHVMGLFRAFWIPEGGEGTDGAYVRFPAHDLLGILALESVRHDALVVGEDLGTVPREVPPALKKWGVLSSKVLYFEKDSRGFKPASSYPALSLATANTHDMPTLAGFWAERDIELRSQLGLLGSEAELRKARAERAADKQALLRTLKLPPPSPNEDPRFPRAMSATVHDFLCSTPAALVGVSLDDLVGEREPVNIPGAPPDVYPSWRRRSRMTMEEVSWSFEVDDALGCNARRRETE